MNYYENRNLQDLDGEIWKTIEEYPDYKISSFGRIKRVIPDKWNHKLKILSQHKDRDGYLLVGLSKNKKGKTEKVHRLLFETFIGEIPEGFVIHHINFTKDNYLGNFELMLILDHDSLHKSGKNHPLYGKKHSIESKNKNRNSHLGKYIGENNPASILKEQEVIQIKLLLDEGILTQREIGGMFGVSRSAISNIKNGRTWKYI